MEVQGVEPWSENLARDASPCAVSLLNFAPSCAEKRARNDASNLFTPHSPPGYPAGSQPVRLRPPESTGRLYLWTAFRLPVQAARAIALSFAIGFVLRFLRGLKTATARSNPDECLRRNRSPPHGRHVEWRPRDAKQKHRQRLRIRAPVRYSRSQRLQEEIRSSSSAPCRARFADAP